VSATQPCTSNFVSQVKNHYLTAIRSRSVDVIIYVVVMMDHWLHKRLLLDIKACAAPLGIMHALESFNESEFDPDKDFLFEEFGIDLAAGGIKRPAMPCWQWGKGFSKKRPAHSNSNGSHIGNAHQQEQRSLVVATLEAAVQSPDSHTTCTTDHSCCRHSPSHNARSWRGEHSNQPQRRYSSA
jgi:hypothetical protein